MLVAVLQARAARPLAGLDVYASVVGGLRVHDPGADLAVAIAVSSALVGIAAPQDLVAVGEVGLGGELRQAPHTARRLAEAARLGHRVAVVPASTPDVAGIRLLRADHLRDVLDAFEMEQPNAGPPGLRPVPGDS